MDFSLTRPCPECPFTDQPDAVRGLREARIDELCEGMLSSQGITFACHNTTGVKGGSSGKERHCAGALIFALKQDSMTQMMRIASRLGWNPDALLEDVAAVASVYDSTEAMQEGHRVTLRRGQCWKEAV